MEAIGRFIAMSLLMTYSAAMFVVCDAASSSVRTPIAPSSVHAHDHAHAEDMSGVVETADRDRDETRAEWKAKCMCGCSDTHFQPGHATARLGSVVPGTVVARLVEATAPPIPVRSPDRPCDFFFEIDPVPV